MKNIRVHELLVRLRQYFQDNENTKKYANEEPPLRAELFNTEQLEQHGRYLARTHKAGGGRTPDRLLKRLANNEKILVEVRNLLTDAIKEDSLITPAGEWLLDNFYLVEDQIRTGKRHLPKGYSESLPVLTTGASAGLPRVYDIALELIAHSDGRIDIDSLTGFVRAYQEIAGLQLGELWAIPIMVRLALIENLRRVAARIAVDRINQSLAGYWARLMVETSEKDPKSLILVIADMARSGPPMESSYVAELIRQLMWKGPGLALPLTWMEQRLSESGLNSNELINLENQKQAADQVSISNSIGSLRFLGAIEWREFVEENSAVEQTLRKDPAGIYAAMDFSTRDRYRHAVEKIAKFSGRSENDIAAMVIKLASKKDGANGTGGYNHIGDYLVGEHAAETEKTAGLQLPASDKFQRLIKKFPLSFYAGAISAITLAVACYLLFNGCGIHANRILLLLTAPFVLLASAHFATALVNWMATIIFKPELLPRMNYANGIPPEYKTLVVVPTMLVNEAQVERLAEALEIRFLANRDPNLFYGLLTDFTDSTMQTLPDDDAVLQTAQKKIEELNQQYAGEKRFFLFHRPRKWNPHDKIWMGYERKRGKLSELNELLRGKNAENFSLVHGDMQALQGVKYVITLDTDTQLPREAAWKMVATMAHPLNHPVYDDRRRRITRGYGILQPRVSVSLSRTGRTPYSSIYGNESGVDPYTRLTSDVYQDIFLEGSFIGKGIYELDAFERALNNRFPENRILSHDLLEGCYTRAGLLSDVELYEEYPPHYSADVNRRHRWIRGDWQIGYWALPVVPDKNRKLGKNPLSALSRWKIFDNLRRSLTPLAFTLLLLLSWTILHAPLFWTFAVLVMILVPPLISSSWGIFRISKEVRLIAHLKMSLEAVAERFFQNAFFFVCLPYETYYCIDAIMRTAWRILVSHKKLLEWRPSGHQEHTSDKTPGAAYYSMWFSPFLAVTAFTGIAAYFPLAIIFAFPVIALWAVAPFIAWWVSKPFPKPEAQLSAGQVTYLRRIARKTWLFFDQFVNEGENWLPPDNYQESPSGIIAHRTSPTNIGLSLLANLTAYDFGYIPAGTLLTRTSGTLNTLTTMERYQGHLYNWYDTISLKPLHPKYVSTVDSGNMAGHLLVLRQGLLALSGEKIISARLFEGIRDTFSLLKNEITNEDVTSPFDSYLHSILKKESIGPREAMIYSSQLLKYLEEIQSAAKTGSGVRIWITEITKQCQAICTEAEFLFPWAMLPPTPSKFNELHQKLRVNTLAELSQFNALKTEAEQHAKQDLTDKEKKWLNALITALDEATNRAADRMETIAALAAQCTEFADVDYSFLYDKSKHLLTIGYNVDDHRRDSGYYDLLASEASLCSFIAIAQGKLPQENWFALGRLLTNTGGSPVLLSWSGSMFEYLMPGLVMPAFENTLLDRTHMNAVKRQIEYGAERGVPWGISESGFNMVDANLNYQYQAFGVPGLGLKRGLAEDLVIAPYASALALMVAPEDACRNMERLSASGMEGMYGLYEAMDYTPSRLPRGQSFAIIQSFMAHHQGMSLLSIAGLLFDQPMQKRFESELQFQATMLLLQERLPKATFLFTHATDITVSPANVSRNTEMRVITTPHTPIPEIQLLSNGKYHVMITNAGGGYSRWKDLAVTRWREDATCDNWGTFCYIRDLEDGAFWSNAWQPTMKQPKHYEATFTQGRAEFRRRDNKIETYTEIVVSPEDDMEMRRIHITNRSRKPVTIDITSYAEVVLAHPAADASHPAFSNLFVQTEIMTAKHAIVCTRRPRSAGERPPWMFHLFKVNGTTSGEASFETDRTKFIGRGRTLAAPEVMDNDGPLSNTQGAVLDPVVSIRYMITLEPDEAISADLITGISETRETCLAMIEKYQDKHHKDRVFELAWTHSQVVLRQINASEADAQLYGQLASSIIFMNPALRATPDILIKNQRGQSDLWGYAVSGDLPIVLLQIENQDNIELAKQLVQAHAYWRLKGLAADLVIWNEDYGGYRQVLQNQILGLIAAGAGSELTDHPGGIYVRAADQISNEDRVLFQTVARIIFSDKRGSLEDHSNKKGQTKNNVPYIIPQQLPIHVEPPFTFPSLQMFNGHGGYAPGGHEYIIISGQGNRTPLPWANILANPGFGSVISESGQSYTWSENAHEFRLTPWENDPVCDRGGEAFYIRDEETGNFWSPVPLPATGRSPYITRHGFGYSVFEHSEDGIYTEMKVFVDIEDPVKIFLFIFRNDSKTKRRISVTGYIDLVLGEIKHKTAMHVNTDVDANTGAILAANQYNKEFANRTGFFDSDDPNRTFTCDRTEFIGRNRSLANPDAMSRVRLSGRSGPGLDPCIAIQTSFTLAEDQERTIVFRLGAGKDKDDATRLIQKFKGAANARFALTKVNEYWQRTLGTMHVDTPDHALNTLANGWLMYQTIACRLWARSGYYQSGGAFGFRDQLQDVLAMLQTYPGLARQQILLCASRQFKEGDVQHWWHPPAGRGVRTTCSDDLLWLPYVTSCYVQKSGDTKILDQQVPFLEGRPLNADEHSYYDLPSQSSDHASLYEHCVAAINHSLIFGSHGLPLIGSGDWNDGMDKVGDKGKGESVWLAFFLYDVLQRFAIVADGCNDDAFAATCRKQAEQLSGNIHDNAWDGEWFRRAYFDDGTPLGSAQNTECSIDSISQSWAVLSGAADPERAMAALAAADKRLVRADDKLIQLLDPPFDKSEMNPGYIKGYVPGIRENGGQYTHAAVWMIMAHAAAGNAKRAWELLDMINPLKHGDTPENIAIYKAEPYVVAADVYSVDPNRGHGGWTWYSGSAGWMYQLITEWLLGIRIEGNTLTLRPCVPPAWDQYKLAYRFGDTLYRITVILKDNTPITTIILDGATQTTPSVTLTDDKTEHTIEVRIKTTSPIAVKQNS